jgi:hypothetical protein
MRGF